MKTIQTIKQIDIDLLSDAHIGPSVTNLFYTPFILIHIIYFILIVFNLLKLLNSSFLWRSIGSKMWAT